MNDRMDPVAAYKTLLRQLIDRRPSGTRRKLAAAFGTHPSFISQITNPSLRVPLPAQHIPALFRICHFSPEEQQAFFELYNYAHPTQSSAIEELAEIEHQVLHIRLPAFKDPERRRDVEMLIREFADRVIALASKTELPDEEDRHEEADEHGR